MGITIPPLTELSLVQGCANYGPWTIWGPPPVFLNKDFLEHRRADLFTYWLSALSRYNRIEQMQQRPYSLQSRKYLTIWLFTEILVSSLLTSSLVKQTDQY